MRTRPRILVLLAVLQLFSPIVNVLLSAFLSHVTISYYLAFIMKGGLLKGLFSYVALPLLSGIAIYMVKPWSIPVTIGITVWNIFTSSSVFKEYQDSYTVPILVLCHVINLAFISYFLIPAVWKIYYTKWMKWWESKPRYRINADGRIHLDATHDFKCKVVDLAINGAFVETVTRKMAVGDIASIEFSYRKQTYSFQMRVAHKTPKTYGVHFIDLDREATKTLQSLIRNLENSRVQRRPERIGRSSIAPEKWLRHFFAKKN